MSCGEQDLLFESCPFLWRSTPCSSPALLYPDVARAARAQGVVVLECVIDEGGRVTAVKVLRGLSLLDQAAIDAVKRWVYSPRLLNGVPVPVVMTVTVNFRLS